MTRTKNTINVANPYNLIYSHKPIFLLVHETLKLSIKALINFSN